MMSKLGELYLPLVIALGWDQLSNLPAESLAEALTKVIGTESQILTISEILTPHPCYPRIPECYTSFNTAKLWKHVSLFLNVKRWHEQ